MKLPIISGKDVIKIFEKIGYKVVRQKGSHVKLRDDKNEFHNPLTIPNHKVLKIGLLKKLIKDANLSVEEFLFLVKDL
ncbi:MAG: type II toxin-antitoxin system HicA family toxin [Actinomycetota bacterium]|nr:type II toxin-antitoxin system HicA family toxin [Actinomycetota bacterium]